MLHGQQILISQCNSYHFNYWAIDKMYTWLDKETPVERSWIRLPCLAVWTGSSLTTLAARIASVFEAFFVGLRYLVYSVYKRDISLAKKGVYEILQHMPKQFLRAAVTPFMFLGGSFVAFAEPKWFVLWVLHINRVNLKHIRAKTLGSESHQKDLSGINFNPWFFRYQGQYSRLYGRSTSTLF